MICCSGFGCHHFFLLLATCLRTLNTCELVVEDTVDSKDNLEDDTMEVTEIKMYHFSRNIFQLGCEVLV